MNSKKTWPSVALISGIVLIIIGALLITGYIIEAYVERIGEPDQSLLFWYLPFLMFGLIAFVTGVSFSIWGTKRLRKIKRQNFSNDGQDHEQKIN
jgi:choline-glycine betaine transporter